MRCFIVVIVIWGSTMCFGQDTITNLIVNDKKLSQIWADINVDIQSVSDMQKINKAFNSLNKIKKSEKLRLLIAAMDLDQVVGRENNRICDEAIAMLQLEVLLTYEFSWGQYKSNKGFRKKIQQGYQKWYENVGKTVKWNTRVKLYLTGKETDEEIRKHRDWRMSLRW